MVNQPVSVDGNPPVSGDDPLGPLVIEDTTEEAQLTRERALLEGRDPNNLEEPAVITGAEGEPVEGVGVQPESNNPAEQSPASTETEEQRINRLIDSRTQSLQSGFDKQIAAANKATRLAEEKNQQADLAARVEVELRRQTAELSESMGPEDARNYVRSEANEKLVTDSYTQAARNEQLESQAAQQGMQTKATLMLQWVEELKNEYNLAEEDVMALAQTVQLDQLNTEQGFEQAGVAIHRLATRMGTSKNPSSMEQVPREQPGNAPGTGRSTSNTPTSDSTLTASARDKPAWSWTEAEHAAMRRSSFGV